jgi:hypothetical protein
MQIYSAVVYLSKGDSLLEIIAQQKKFICSVKGEVFLRGISILYDLNTQPSTQPSTQEGVITCRGISYQLICNCYL